MALAIPDSRMLMPELLIPGRKPVGNVEIDWSNSLTTGLRYYTLCNSLNVVDLVTGKQTAASSDPVIFKGDLKTSRVSSNSADIGVPSIEVDFQITDQASIVVWLDSSDIEFTTSFSPVVQISENAFNDIRFGIEKDNGARYDCVVKATGSSSVDITSTSTETNETTFMVITYDGTTLQPYRNGVATTSATGAT